MPHRPNPIPRFNGSNNAQQSPSSLVDPTVVNTRREREIQPPRHRAGSLHTQSGHARDLSPSLVSSTLPLSSTVSTMPSTATGSGRSGGRALPPPRFQRKQRPPRVQQAIAAANASSNSTPNTNSRGSRRGGPNASTTTGTLALGPANNWGTGTGSVVSLSMATINAASARASVVHRQQPTTIPPLTSQLPPQLPPLATPTGFDVGDFMEENASYASDDFRGLDPVQLHNRLTFGMGRPRNDSFNSDYAHGPMEPATPPLHPHIHPYPTHSIPPLQPVAPPTARGNNRPRGRSHNQPHAQTFPPQPLNQHQNPRNSYGYTGGYNVESPASSIGTGIPYLHSLPQAHSSLIDPDGAYRGRSHSFVHPLENVAAMQQPPSFAGGPLSSLPHHLRAPANHSSPQLTLDTQLDAITSSLLSTSFANQSFISNGSTSSLPTNASNPSYTSLPSNQSGPSPTTRRPLKSALKVRKSAPELIDTSMANADMGFQGLEFPVPPMPSHFVGHPQVLERHPSSAQPPYLESNQYDDSPTNLPDPNFSLPDSLQAQYAYQLKLLQQEYAFKAAKAERIRQRTDDRGVVDHRGGYPAGRATGLDPVVTTGLEPTMGRFNGMMLGDREEDSMTPPSSGGGSGSGHRVSFHEEVGVIEGGAVYDELDAYTGVDPDGYAAYDTVEYELEEAGLEGQEEGGYASWDDEWEEHGVEEVEEQDPEGEEEEEAFNYAFGDGFGSLDPTAPSGMDGGAISSSAVSISLSQLEEDGGSVMGDRGHEDQRQHQPSRASSTNLPQEDSEASPLDPVVSPTRAVFHGHGVEESPTVSNNSSNDMIGRIQDSERGDDDASMAQPDYIMVPQVEVIAPTPVMRTTELVNPFEAEVLKTLEGEEEIKGKGEEEIKGKGEEENRKSEDSIGQKNSSNSTEEGSSGSNDSNATVQRQAEAAATAKEAASTAPLSLATSVPAILPTDVPFTNSPIDAPAQSQLPPSLQRLAHRLSRGGGNVTPTPSYPVAASSIAQPPGVPSTLRSQQDASFEPQQPVHFPSFVPSMLPSSPLAPQVSARATPTQESHRSHSGRRRSAQQPINRQHISSQNDNAYSASMGFNQGFTTRQSNPSLRSLSLMEDLNAPLPPPQVYPSNLRARHSSLAVAEMSSAASVESGSSHGGGTSGGSHAHPFGRPLTGSSHHAHAGVFGANTRFPPSVTSILPSERASASTRSLPRTVGNAEGWEEDPRLFNVRSNESLRAASVTSGRSAGSGGSGKATGRGFGGESIWTLKEDEGAKWPSAPPSSSGHSIGARNPNPWMLQSLINDSMSQSLSSEGRSHLEENPFVDDMPATGYTDVSRHPYQSHPATRFDQSVSSFQSNLSFGDSPSAPAFRNPNVPQRTFGQSQSTPAFLQYEGSDNSHNSHYTPEDLDRLRAMRVAQVRAQAAPYAPPPPPAFSHQKRYAPPPPARSMPSIDINQYHYSEEPVTSMPPLPSNRRDRNSMTSGSSHHSAGNMVTLPASGGVFPRLQEVPGDASRMGGANSGRFKGLFKNRDSRVFK